MIEKKEYEDPFEKEPCASCKSKWIAVMDNYNMIIGVKK